MSEDEFYRAEEIRVRAQNSRARTYGKRDDLTVEDWLATVAYFGGACAYCGGPFEVLEHIYPVEIDGTSQTNCVPACLSCNAKKGAGDWAQFIISTKRFTEFFAWYASILRYDRENYARYVMERTVNFDAEAMTRRHEILRNIIKDTHKLLTLMRQYPPNKVPPDTLRWVWDRYDTIMAENEQAINEALWQKPEERP